MDPTPKNNADTTTAKLLAGLLEGQQQQARRELFWRNVRGAAIAIALVAGPLIYSLTINSILSPGSARPSGDYAALVRIEGSIAPGARANAEAVNRSLRRAFNDEDSVAVIVVLDSPGGSAVQSEMIHDQILGLRYHHPDKPVWAVGVDQMTSGAYLVASATQHICVSAATLTGSIGVIHSSWGLSGAARQRRGRNPAVQRGGTQDPAEHVCRSGRRGPRQDAAAPGSGACAVFRRRRPRARRAADGVAGGALFGGFLGRGGSGGTRPRRRAVHADRRHRFAGRNPYPGFLPAGRPLRSGHRPASPFRPRNGSPRNRPRVSCTGRNARRLPWLTPPRNPLPDGRPRRRPPPPVAALRQCFHVTEPRGPTRLQPRVRATQGRHLHTHRERPDSRHGRGRGRRRDDFSRTPWTNSSATCRRTFGEPMCS